MQATMESNRAAAGKWLDDEHPELCTCGIPTGHYHETTCERILMITAVMSAMAKHNAPLNATEDVTQSDCDVIADLIFHHYTSTQPHMGYECVKNSLAAEVHDDCGWAGGSPIVRWEEGPEDWAYADNIPVSVEYYCKLRDLFVSPVRSWVVSIHQI